MVPPAALGFIPLTTDFESRSVRSTGWPNARECAREGPHARDVPAGTERRVVKLANGHRLSRGGSDDVNEALYRMATVPGSDIWTSRTTPSGVTPGPAATSFARSSTPSPSKSSDSSRRDAEPLGDRASDVNVQLGGANCVLGEHCVVGAFDLDDVPTDHARGLEVPRWILSTADKQLSA